MANKTSAGKPLRKILDSGIVGTVSRRDIRTAIKAVQVERKTASGQTSVHGNKAGGSISKRK